MQQFHMSLRICTHHCGARREARGAGARVSVFIAHVRVYIRVSVWDKHTHYTKERPRRVIDRTCVRNISREDPLRRRDTWRTTLPTLSEYPVPSSASRAEYGRVLIVLAYVQARVRKYCPSMGNCWKLFPHPLERKATRWKWAISRCARSLLIDGRLSYCCNNVVILNK